MYWREIVSELEDQALVGEVCWENGDKLTKLLRAAANELDCARNELCLYCGRYKEAHNGACEGCRFK